MVPTVLGMLGLRIEGAADEAHAFLDALRIAGVEVRIGTTKDRGGFAHVYAEIRVPGYEPPAAATGRPVPGTVARTGRAAITRSGRR